MQLEIPFSQRLGLSVKRLAISHRAYHHTKREVKMATATITVQELRQPAPGKKKAIIVDTNGDYYYIWPNDIGLYQQGGVYDVVFEASQFRNMTIRNINSSRPSSQPAAAPAPRIAPQ